MITPNGLLIQSVAFSDEAVQVSFMEPDDVKVAQRGVARIITLEAPVGMLEDELVDLLEAIETLVDRMGVARRDPPERFTPR